MITFDDIKSALIAEERTLLGVAEALDIEALEARAAELAALQDDQNLWSDLARAQQVAQEAKKVNNKIFKKQK